MPTSRLALALPLTLLVASAASGQATGRDLSAFLGLYQVKAEVVGRAFGCLMLEDSHGFFTVMAEAIQARDTGHEDTYRELLEDGDLILLDRLDSGQCKRLDRDDIFQRWSSEEEYPHLIGVRRQPFGAPTGRVWWVYRGWLEPAQ